jgi:hypothetical protein
MFSKTKNAITQQGGTSTKRFGAAPQQKSALVEVLTYFQRRAPDMLDVHSSRSCLDSLVENRQCDANIE